MRRRTASLGWPRYDPRHYRFAIPNAVWEYSLKPVEFLIFSYLCYHRAPDILTPETIAGGVHMTVGTVKKYLGSLSAKGLVNEGGTPALECKTVKFFTLPNEIFLLRLPPSAFLVYAYLLLIEDRQSHTCHPSYNTIAAATGISKSTAMKSVNTLLEMGLITVESSSYFDKHGLKWKGNNLYTILYNSSGEAGGRCVSPTTASMAGVGSKAQTSSPTAKGIRPPSPQRCLVCPDPSSSSN